MKTLALVAVAILTAFIVQSTAFVVFIAAMPSPPTPSYVVETQEPEPEQTETEPEPEPSETMTFNPNFKNDKSRFCSRRWWC